jgi:hypothetical protein
MPASGQPRTSRPGLIPGPSPGSLGLRRFTSLDPDAHRAEQGMRRASSPFLFQTLFFTQHAASGAHHRRSGAGLPLLCPTFVRNEKFVLAHVRRTDLVTREEAMDFRGRKNHCLRSGSSRPKPRSPKFTSACTTAGSRASFSRGFTIGIVTAACSWEGKTRIRAR